MAYLYSCETLTTKNVNQDYCLTIHNTVMNFSGIIIADGIGSHFRSELASKFCCERLRDLLENCNNNDDLDFEIFFEKVKSYLVEFSAVALEDQVHMNSIDKEKALSTTLICVVDLGDEYIMAYVGNGSIWQIDGRFNSFSKNYYLPWNSINLLNPHCIEEEGKSALYRYVSIADVPNMPTVLRLKKNKLLSGEIIVVTTDGIFSNDEVRIGKDENQTIWIRGEESMPLLYKHLSEFLATNPKESVNEDLKFTLARYLNELKAKSLIHDDTTLAVIISEKTIQYHQKIFEKRLTVNAENTNQ